MNYKLIYGTSVPLAQMTYQEKLKYLLIKSFKKLKVLKKSSLNSNNIQTQEWLLLSLLGYLINNFSSNHYNKDISNNKDSNNNKVYLIQIIQNKIK